MGKQSNFRIHLITDEGKKVVIRQADCPETATNELRKELKGTQVHIQKVKCVGPVTIEYQPTTI